MKILELKILVPVNRFGIEVEQSSPDFVKCRNYIKVEVSGEKLYFETFTSMDAFKYREKEFFIQAIKREMKSVIQTMIGDEIFTDFGALNRRDYDGG